MNLRSIDLNLLTIFDAIMAERNMTRAAARLGLTQPAMSNALGRLRKLVDDPLFVRTARGMTPTPRAQALAPRLHQALEAIRMSLSEEERFDPARAARTFTLAIGDYCEVLFLPRLVQKLRAQKAPVQFSMVPQAGATLAQELRDGRVDLVWDSVPVDRPGFNSEPILTDEVVCVLSRDHPLARKKLTPATYEALDHVRLTPAMTYVHEFDQFARRRGIHRHFAVEVPRIVSMLFMVAGSDLAATLPAQLAKAFSAQLNLVAKPLPFPGPRSTLYQSWHVTRDDDPAHRWLRQAMRETIPARLQPTEKN